MKKVRKAVIPAAGLGTRVLPATKVDAQGDAPHCGQARYPVYCGGSGCRPALRTSSSSPTGARACWRTTSTAPPSWRRRLAGDPAKEAILNQVVGISKLANIFYVRQKETKGLGHAIGCAREFVGDEPFAVLYGDDVIIGRGPRLRPADARL